MSSRRKSSAMSLAVKSAELAFAVPQVVAHRVTRMALAGPEPSKRDLREFERMVAEKNAAFVESWHAMGVATFRANQSLSASALTSFWSAALGMKPSSSTRHLRSTALGIIGQGLTPVHRKVVANAKRLGRSRRR